MGNVLNKKLWIKYSIFSLVAIVICLIDQLSKSWIVKLTGGKEGLGPIVIDKVLKFSYKKNYGASMGILDGQRILLIVLTFVILGLGIYYIKKHKFESCLLLTAASLIAGGAVGNLIDRIFLGFVRDFIHLLFINFYIFNVADCAICVGAGLLIIYAFKYIED